MFKKRIFTKSADSIFTEPSHFLETSVSKKTFSRFITNLEISGNLRETCQLIKEA